MKSFHRNTAILIATIIQLSHLLLPPCLLRNFAHFVTSMALRKGKCRKKLKSCKRCTKEYYVPRYIWFQKNCWSKWENHWSRFQTFNLSKAFDVITNSPYCCPSVLVLVLVLAYSLGINLTMVAVVTSWNI